jgi:hypothetical protein
MKGEREMAWTMNGSGGTAFVLYIAPGNTVRVSFAWDHPGDMGPQWVMAHPLRGEPPSAIATERVAKTVDCEIGSLTVNSGVHYYGCGDPNTAYWGYYADLTNDGSEGCNCLVQGGGV